MSQGAALPRPGSCHFEGMTLLMARRTDHLSRHARRLKKREPRVGAPRSWSDGGEPPASYGDPERGLGRKYHRPILNTTEELKRPRAASGAQIPPVLLKYV